MVFFSSSNKKAINYCKVNKVSDLAHGPLVSNSTAEHIADKDRYCNGKQVMLYQN